MAYTTDERKQQHSSSFKGHMSHAGEQIIQVTLKTWLRKVLPLLLFQYQQKCLQNSSATKQQKINSLYILSDSLLRLKASAFLFKVYTKA